MELVETRIRAEVVSASIVTIHRLNPGQSGATASVAVTTAAQCSGVSTSDDGSAAPVNPVIACNMTPAADSDSERKTTHRQSTTSNR